MDTLFKQSRRCAQDFEKLKSHLAHTNPEYAADMPPSTIGDQLGKFSVWCGNLGALQTGYSSLDYRLRESTVMKTTVANLLMQLSSGLNESIAVVSGERLPFEKQPKPDNLSEESTDEDSDTDGGFRSGKELLMRVSSIISCLNSLYRLAYKIRNPSLKPASRKANYYEETDPETGVNVFDRFGEYDNRHVVELLDSLRQGRVVAAENHDYLVSRLTMSITLRRRHFKYWQRHSEKLSRGVDIDIIPEQLHRSVAKMDIDSAIEHENEEPKLDKGKKITEPLPPTTIMSKTDATPYDPLWDDITEKETAFSIVSTALDVDGKGIEIPGPPDEARRGEPFACPYCFVLCPARQGSDKTWRQHVLHDLQPYVCTYESCTRPDELYRSRNAWVKHENSVHRQYWRCFDHPDKVYTSATRLQHHLLTGHPSLKDETQLENLLGLYSFSISDDRKSCPICLQEQPFATGMTNHLASHLERIALFSLPRAYSESPGKETGSEDVENNRASSFESFDDDSSSPGQLGRRLRSSICKVRSCDLEHDHRPVFGESIYSLYCRNHTCSASFADGSFCVEATPQNVTYCFQHGICQAQHCSKTPKSRPSAANMFFCKDHICAAPECHDSRTGLGNYCSSHQCVVTGCFRQVTVISTQNIDDDQSQQASPYHTYQLARWHNTTLPRVCSTHKCRHATCPELSAWQDGYCGDHSSHVNHETEDGEARRSGRVRREDKMQKYLKQSENRRQKKVEEIEQRRLEEERHPGRGRSEDYVRRRLIEERDGEKR